jgi:hypothetical protein
MPKKKTTKYNIILKQFTKLNNQLPEDRKLSIKERRRIMKEDIMPQFADVPKSKLRVKAIKQSLIIAYDKVPPKEICDLNYIDTSEFAFVEWYALDETLNYLVPNCVYVKVSAGEFGETNIFNTRNYEYGKSKVRSIVELIRTDAKDKSGKFLFSGYKKLRPRKSNNGEPENYYLDFVLFELDKKGNIVEAMADAESVDYQVPKTRENRKIKTKINNLIEEKIKKLRQTKESKKRAKSTLKKNIDDFVKKSKNIAKAKKPSNTRVEAKNKQFNKTSALLEKYFKDGKLTQKQYDIALEKLLREYEK